MNLIKLNFPTEKYLFWKVDPKKARFHIFLKIQNNSMKVIFKRTSTKYQIYSRFLCCAYLENVLTLFIFDTCKLFLHQVFNFPLSSIFLRNTHEKLEMTIIKYSSRHLKMVQKGERVNDAAGSRMWMCGILIFACGKTEHGDRIYRVLVSWSAFLFRDFRSRASLLYNREFLRAVLFETW